MDQDQVGSAQLRSLLDISLQLTGGLEIEPVLVGIVERSMELTGARYGAAVTIGPQGGIERFLHRGLTEEQVATLPHLPEGKGLLGLVLEEKVPVRVDRIDDHESSVGFPDTHVPMHAFLGLPLLHRGDLVGALYLTKSPGDPPFSQADEELLMTVAALASVGVVNARLFAAESGRAERAALLQDISAQVRRSLDLSKVLSATVQALGRAARADRCFIRLAERSGDIRLAPVEYEWTAQGVEPVASDPERQFPISSLAAITGQTQWSDDITEDDRLVDPSLPGSPEDLLHFQSNAALSTPLMWGEQFLGVVTIHSITPREWVESDIALVEATAREVSVAIHHARRYSSAVAEAEKLQELELLRSDFVSMVSHELRSPMTVVQGIADILQTRDRQLTPEQRIELIDTLGREAHRLSRMVSEVLDLEAMDRGSLVLQRADVDMGELAHESAADSGEGGRIKVVVDEGDAKCHVDRDRVKQVFLNLISNAAKFSDSDDEIILTIRPQEDWIVSSIADRGPGIADEEQSQLFQRFGRLRSTAEEKPGSGLGLYLSRSFIQQHGGSIWVDSTPGEGATFSFRIPRRA